MDNKKVTTTTTTTTMIIIILIQVNQFKSLNATNQNNTQLERLRNYTTILDTLLRNYDPNIRPNFNGSGSPPTNVLVDIFVRDMSGISELKMEYTFNCYFRQQWQDSRLAFKNGPLFLIVNIKMLEKLWKPDTYFLNSHGSDLHKVPNVNKFFRIYQDGTILYSMRLTIKATCPMYLESFPIDTQNCPLYIGSFSYPNSDIVYKWNRDINADKKRAINIANDMQLSQFDLQTTFEFEENQTYHNKTFSVLLATFKLDRQISYFVLQIYIPCMLIVFLSWVGFYINREATADRISLGVTSVLTIALLIMESKIELPKVSYLTAFDIYLEFCFGFVLSSVFEFAIVHHYTKFSKEEIRTKEINLVRKISTKSVDSHKLKSKKQIIDKNNGKKSENYEDCYNNNNKKKRKQIIDDVESFSSFLSLCSTLSCDFFYYLRAKRQIRLIKKAVEKQVKKQNRIEQFNKVSQIDYLSRIFYPIVFVLFNIIYWCIYLNRRSICANV